MRLRHKKWAEKVIVSHPSVALERAAVENKTLPNFNALEIGSGCGSFLLQMAIKNPDINYLGVEINRTAFAIAIKKYAAMENRPANLCFVNCDIAELLPMIEDDSLDTVYLNFNDPWPKKKHNKRRLTYPDKLEGYHRILKKNGRLLVKTDNSGYFEDSLQYFLECRLFSVQGVRNYETEEGDAVSEYEAKFRLMDRPIYRIVAVKDHD